MASEEAAPAQACVIHGSIVRAVTKVQAAIAAVTKDGNNEHGRYRFASTDAIYAMLTHKLAEVGLMIMCLEDEKPEIVRVEKKDKEGRDTITQWGKFVFSFVLATEEATWTDPRSRRSLFVQITGPQTFQAANSFAEKTYLRSLFKMPTGDMDLDALPQAETEEDQIALVGANGKKRKSSAEGKRDGSVKVFNTINAEIKAAATVEELHGVRTKHTSAFDTMPRAWHENLMEEFSVKMEALGGEYVEEVA